MQRTFFTTASVLCGIAVVLGAFGAHALKERLTPELLATFETGVRYQFYHGLALLLLGIIVGSDPGKFFRFAGFSFIGGVIFFSGSLYTMCLLNTMGVTDYKWLGPVTPLGGLCFITGWVFLLLGVRRKV